MAKFGTAVFQQRGVVVCHHDLIGDESSAYLPVNDQVIIELTVVPKSRR